MTVESPSFTSIVRFSGLVGWCLRRRRRSLGLLQNDLAVTCRIGPSAWSRIESGETPITVAHLSCACRMLKIGSPQVLAWADILANSLAVNGYEIDWGNGTGEEELYVSPVSLSGILDRILRENQL